MWKYTKIITKGKTGKFAFILVVWEILKNPEESHKIRVGNNITF